MIYFKNLEVVLFVVMCQPKTPTLVCVLVQVGGGVGTYMSLLTP